MGCATDEMCARRESPLVDENGGYRSGEGMNRGSRKVIVTQEITHPRPLSTLDSRTWP